MASHYFAAPPHYMHNGSTPAPSSHGHGNGGHHGRSRRGPRVSSQNAHRQYKAQRSPKEMQEAAASSSPTAHADYVQRLEAAMSFEFDDDEVFCPFHLLTEDDLQSIHSSSSSDRGSLSSGSPSGSPLQQQVQPTPTFLLSSAANSFNPTPAGFHQHHAQQHHHQQMKLHQPMAQRSRNAIPIVDPSTRSIASPPLSVSPGRQMQGFVSRRW